MASQSISIYDDSESMDIDNTHNNKKEGRENLPNTNNNSSSSPVTGKRKHPISPIASSTQTNASLEVFDDSIVDPNAISPEHKKRIVPEDDNTGTENLPVTSKRGRGTRRSVGKGGVGRGAIYKAPSVTKKLPPVQTNKRVQPKRITKKATKKLNTNKPVETTKTETQGELMNVMLNMQKQMSQMQDDTAKNAKNLEKTASKEDIEQIVDKAQEGLNQQIQKFTKDIESCNRRIEKLEDDNEDHTRKMYEITKDVQELKIDMALRRDAEKKTRERCKNLEELKCNENIEELKHSVELLQTAESKYNKLQQKIDEMDIRMSKMGTTMKEIVDNPIKTPTGNVPVPGQSQQRPKQGKGLPDNVRRKNIVIDGLEERQHEDLIVTVKAIAEELEISLSKREINNAFRMGMYTKNRKRPRPVMVSLDSEKKKK